MARYSPYRAAKVQQKEPGRPILVILVIVAMALGLFWWLQSDRLEGDAAGSLTGDRMGAAEAAIDAPVAAPTESAAASGDSDLRSWWGQVEVPIADALRAGQAVVDDPSDTFACDDLTYQVSTLSQLPQRPEATLAAPINSITRSLERAASACSTNPKLVGGSVASAKQHLHTLVENAAAYGLDRPYGLEEFL